MKCLVALILIFDTTTAGIIHGFNVKYPMEGGGWKGSKRGKTENPRTGRSWKTEKDFDDSNSEETGDIKDFETEVTIVKSKKEEFKSIIDTEMQADRPVDDRGRDLDKPPCANDSFLLDTIFENYNRHKIPGGGGLGEFPESFVA